METRIQREEGVDGEGLSKAYEHQQVEPRWYGVWMERGYFHADDVSDKPPFSIVLPPPNITGLLHLGHALTATLQDVLIRWKRMSGYNAMWLPGTDHAGIATQMMVERELRVKEKKSRYDLGREEFLKRVWAWKEMFGRRIGEQHKALGASLDWERERFTLDEGVSRAVREVFVRLYEEGLIYRAHRLINWCPQCRTALSDLEVDHVDKQGSLWHIAYPVKGSDQKLIVATTRPETMLGDTAVAVHPKDPRYKDLIGKTVVLPLLEREIPVIADEILVSMELGTGAVKVTPAHDFNDYEVGQRHRLPMISVIDEAGKMTDAAGPYRGLDRFAARKKVVADLEARGLLIKVEPHALALGVCQRSQDVVEPMLSLQWYVKVEPLAREAIAAVEQKRTVILPETWEATYFSWMRNIRDWCISRQLWWGHQIPAWYCQTPKCEGLHVGRQAPQKPCEKCGQSAWKQDEDVLDTWFSSGLWPFSTLGWPENTPALKTFYPTSVMETGHDILFFWVARMMMLGLHFMREVPFRTVYLHAMVRDEKGEKMSKTKGNVIDPLVLVEKYGADSLRFTLAALTAAGRDIKMSEQRVAGYRAFANKIWNAARFAFMNLSGFTPGGKPLAQEKLSLADRWVLSRLRVAVEQTQAALEAYDFSEAASTVYQFIWHELCDWYIELSKGVLAGPEGLERQAAQAVLVHCLDHSLRLLHPFMPFVSEEIWQKLPKAKGAAASIMIAPFPRAEQSPSDPAAEEQMAPVIAAITGLRRIRGESNVNPGKKIPAIIQASGEAVLGTLRKNQAVLVSLAGLSSVEITRPGNKPEQCATFVDAQLEAFVPLAGLIDIEEEKKRIEKELAKGASDIELLEKKLANPNFVARAPREVVEKDQARVAELREKQAKLRESLGRVAGEKTMGENNQGSDGKSPEEAISPSSQGTVKVAQDPGGGTEDLARDLASAIQSVDLPDAPGPQVKQALVQLKEGTREGLSKSDHYDLGVAYLGMGLVEDAVDEFNRAGVGGATTHGQKKASSHKAVAAKRRKPAKTKGVKVKKVKAKGAKARAVKPRAKAKGARASRVGKTTKRRPAKRR